MYELLPSCWGTFRTTSKTSPATGERFVLLRKPPQLLGNVSYCFESLPSCWGTLRTASKASPVAGEHFQLLESFPSRWGAFPASGILPQLLAEYRPGHFQVGGRRELDIFAVAVHKGDGMPGGFDHRSIVGEERRVGLVVSITK